jgi:hypothetical protein
MNTDKEAQKRMKARLAVAERRWAREDKERGYTVYRHSKPAYKVVQKQENLVVEGILFFTGLTLWVVLLQLI